MEPKTEARPPSAPLERSAKHSFTSAISLDVPMKQLSLRSGHAATPATHTCMRRCHSQPELIGDVIDFCSMSTQYPSLQFTIFHDVQHSSLTVQLQRAYNLPPKGRFHTCNPFVCVFMLPNKEEVFKSKKVEKDFNPIFNEWFHFNGVSADEVGEHTLVFRVFDHVRFLRNEFIGCAIVPLRNADMLGDTVVKTIDDHENLYYCQNFSCGADILFSLEYDDHNMHLQGVVHKATNMGKQDVWGKADPYVKIYLLYKGKKNKKWKTKTKKNTLTPVFNESFQFDISHLDIQDISLEFVLMDYDRFNRNGRVGVVQVGSHAALEWGRTHWQQILFSPQQAVRMWHPMKTPDKLKKTVQK